MSRKPKFVTIAPSRDYLTVVSHERARAAVTRSRMSTRLGLAKTVTV